MDKEELSEEEPKKGVFPYFIAVFLLLLVVVYIIPHYAIAPDPKPKAISSLETVRHFLKNQTSLRAYNNVHQALNATSVKEIANYIATEACPNGNRVCYAKAIYAFVRDNIAYINDPVMREYVQQPLATIASGGGDCDDGAVLLASLLNSIGIQTEFVFVPNHVLIKAWLPDAAKRYKKAGDWVFLEWTCKQCEFGEMP